MTEEAIADSGETESFDMEGAQADLADALGFTEEVDEEFEEVDELEDEEVEEESTEETEETDESEEVEESEETEVITKEAPQSWKKEMHEKFATLDPDVQDYIEQRESQMKEGLEKDRTDANMGRTIRDVMTPYSNFLQQNGVNEVQMVQNMLGAHYRLSTAPQSEKDALFAQMAQNYGVSINGEKPQEVDPVIQNMQNELNGLKQNITASHEASLRATQEKVQSSVTAFANDEAHPFFDEVSDEIIVFINSGLDLKDAYEKAVWANPVTRQKELDRIQQESTEKAAKAEKQKVEKAKKAKSTNVRGRNTNKPPTETLGTMEDTMHETMREINNRS
jgi:hypothetical protein